MRRRRVITGDARYEYGSARLAARFSSLKFPEADLSGQSLRFMRLKHMRARDNLRPLRWRKVLSSRLQVVRHLPLALIISLALTFLPTRSFAQG